MTETNTAKCWTNQGKCGPHKTKIVWDVLDCWSEEVLCEEGEKTDSQDKREDTEFLKAVRKGYEISQEKVPRYTPSPESVEREKQLIMEVTSFVLDPTISEEERVARKEYVDDLFAIRGPNGGSRYV